MPKIRKFKRKIERSKLGEFNLKLDIKEKPEKEFDVEYTVSHKGRKIAGLNLKRKGNVVFVFDVFVNAEYRKKGIATQMITHIIERCKEKKIPFVVGVAKETAMQKLLKKLGFKRILRGSDMFLLEVRKLEL